MIDAVARYQYRDQFYRKAKERGLRSRAAFKLEELMARFKLAGEGDRVIDLGCAPGGWLEIFAQAVGAGGRVVGIDLVRCLAPGPNVTTLIGDVRDPKVCTAAAAALGSAADLIAGDLAPKLSGVPERDQAKARELLEAALTFARTLLKPGGAMAVKVFMGADFEELRAAFQSNFARAEVVHTRASRPGSSELYLVLRGFSRPLRGKEQ